MMSALPKISWTFWVLVALSSCATATDKSVGELAYQKALNRAFDELQVRDGDGREVASQREITDVVGARFGALRGSIEILVFPKVSNMAEKNSLPAHSDIGAPVTFSLSVVRNLSCAQLLRENSATWSHRAYFARPAEEGLDCAILRVAQKSPERKVANARRGDIKETLLYIDSNYGVHGYDTEILRSRRDSEIVRIQTDSELASGTSGLGIVPIDLPPANAALSLLKENQSLRISEDPFVIRKLKEFRVEVGCIQATHITYKDFFGQRNQIQWCRGDVWPTVVENERFIAVLRRGK